MRDLMKRGLLQPLEKITQDDNTHLEKYEAFLHLSLMKRSCYKFLQSITGSDFGFYYIREI